MIGFNFGGSTSETTQTQNQRFDETSSGVQRRTISPAGATEQDTLQRLLAGLFQNLESVGGLSSGYAGAEQEAIGLYQRQVRSAARSAIGQVARSGFKSSNLSSMMGAFNESAAGPLSQMLIGSRLSERWQPITARSQILGQLAPLLQGYFLQERGMTGTITSDSTRSGTSSGTSRSTGTQSSTGFGFSFNK